MKKTQRVDDETFPEWKWLRHRGHRGRIGGEPTPPRVEEVRVRRTEWEIRIAHVNGSVTAHQRSLDSHLHDTVEEAIAELRAEIAEDVARAERELAFYAGEHADCDLIVPILHPDKPRADA